MFTYTNQGQRFTLIVEGGDKEAVRDYINNAAVYFTVHKIGAKPRTEISLPSLAAILMETITRLTKLLREDLRAALAQRELGAERATLAEVISSLVEDKTITGRILEAAAARATAEYEEAGVDAGTIPLAMTTTLFRAPAAAFLADPTTLPHDHATMRQHLIDHPLSLIVTLDWASAHQKESNDSWVVWFSIDPPARAIAAGETVTYRPKRGATSASSGIKAKEGSMTNYFRRTKDGVEDWRDQRYADVSDDPDPGSMRNSVTQGEKPPKKRDYHSSVTGGASGGKYTISGGWTT